MPKKNHRTSVGATGIRMNATSLSYTCSVKDFIIHKKVKLTSRFSSKGFSRLTIIRVVSNSNYAHRSWYFLPEQYNIFTCVFISSNNCITDPVCPENIVTIHSKIKWMLWRSFCQDLKHDKGNTPQRNRFNERWYSW